MRYPNATVELFAGTPLYSRSHREAHLAFRVVPFDEADVTQRRLVGVAFAVYALADRAVELGEGGRHLTPIEDVRSDLSPQRSWLGERLSRACAAMRVDNRTVQACTGAAGLGLGDAPPARDVWMGDHQGLRTERRLQAFVEIATQTLDEG